MHQSTICRERAALIYILSDSSQQVNARHRFTRFEDSDGEEGEKFKELEPPPAWSSN